MPFGPECKFPDMDACMQAMSGKVDDPGAYCASLMRRTEDHCKQIAALQDELVTLAEGSEEAKSAVLGIDEWLRSKEMEALERHKAGHGPPPTIYKSVGYALPDTDAKAQAIGERVYVASEESEDRVGDIIPISAWSLDQFQKNPVYLYGHNHDMLPIGTVPKIWIDGKQLLNTVVFDPKDEFAQQVKGKFERGILRAQSVGFRALDYERRTGKAEGMLFKKVELLEISAVPVPAHPSALGRAYGMKHGDMDGMMAIMGDMRRMLAQMEGMAKEPKQAAPDVNKDHESIVQAVRGLFACC